MEIRLFHDIDGKDCFINISKADVVSVRHAASGVSRTLIKTKTGESYAVKESPAEVMEILEEGPHEPKRALAGAPEAQAGNPHAQAGN